MQVRRSALKVRLEGKQRRAHLACWRARLACCQCKSFHAGLLVGVRSHESLCRRVSDADRKGSVHQPAHLWCLR